VRCGAMAETIPPVGGQGNTADVSPESKEFRVDNLGTQHDVKSLTDFFKLSGVPGHSVSLYVNGEGNYAIVRVPHEMADAITDADGTELAGRTVTITPHVVPEEVEMSTDGGDATSLTDTFYLRFSQVVKPFGLPNYAEIANTALDYFQDPSLKVNMKRLGAEKIYRIQLPTKTDMNNRSLTLRCNGEDVRFPLLTEDPFENKRGREEGILLTLQGAYEGDLEALPNSVFDKAVAAFNLQIIVPTRLQKVAGSVALNGNRYCIIKKVDNLNSIPEFLPVTHPVTKKLYNVKSTFKDQARSCTRCLKKHVGQCPEMKKFFEALDNRKKLKEEKRITTKIMSDSTMRLADPLGLTAEVSTMSGGGLGQVVQAALDDPEITKMDDVVIVGGANDIKCQSFETIEEFAQNIDASVDKVVGMANANPTKNYTIVNSHPRIESPRDPVNTSIKTLYLHRKLMKVAADETVPNLSVTDAHYDTDATTHPTDEGTKFILHALHHSVGNNSLIWNKDFIVSKRIYLRVEEIFKYGCNHCDKYGVDIKHDFKNPVLCDTCHLANKENASKNRYPLLEQIVAEINETVLDDQASINSSGDGEPLNKRQRLPGADGANRTVLS
jgi:hypothetical protein